MANTVPILSYANTFSDWYVVTNALSQENNILGKEDYTKDSGTLYLSETTQNALQSNGNIVVQKQLLVQGLGSSATVQNNLTVGGQVYFTNTTLSLIASGQANVLGPVFALAPNTGLTVANSATIGANLTTLGSGSFGANVVVGGWFSTTGNSKFTGPLVASQSVSTANLIADAISSGGTATANYLQANTALLTGTVTANTLVNTANLVAGVLSAGPATVSTLQANTTILAASISANTLISAPNVIGTAISGTTVTVDTVQANTSVTANSLVANTLITTANLVAGTLSSGGTATVNRLQANTSVLTGTVTANTLISSPNIIGTEISGTTVTVNIVQGNTSVTTGTVNANTLVSTANLIAGNLSSGGTATVNRLAANTLISGPNAVVTAISGTSVTVDTVQANTSVTANTLTANTLLTAANLVAGTLSSGGTATVNRVQANTSVVTGTLTANTSMLTGVIVANTSVTANTLSANTLLTAPNVIATAISGSAVTVDTVQANTSVLSNTITANSTVNVTGSTQVDNAVAINITTANSAYPGLLGGTSNTGLISRTTLNVTGPLSSGNTSFATINVTANQASIVVSNGSNTLTMTPLSISGGNVAASIKSLVTTGSVQVGGNFILSGTTVYATNMLTLSAGALANSNNSIEIDRLQSPGASNAAIRWNEVDKYWDVKNVATSSTYTKIVVDQDPSTSITLQGYLRVNGVVSTQSTVVPAATTTLNLALYDNFIITLDKNITFSLTNIGTKIGSSGCIVLKQDATGGRTFTKATEMKTPLGGAAITQYTAANSLSLINYYVVDASTVLINYIGNFA